MRDLGTSQDVIFTLGHVIQCNSFPTLTPLSSEFLPKVNRSVSTFWVVIPVVDADSVIVVSIEMLSIECCCVAVWQTNATLHYY